MRHTFYLISKRQLCTLFLYISLPLSCTTTTWNFQKLPSYAFYGGSVVCVSIHFFSQPLISTLVAASISPFSHHRCKILVFLPTKLVSFGFYLSLYNLGQNCWKNCILGEYFSKHRSCTVSSLSPFPWKQCCFVFKRKPVPWAFVGSNIELGKGDFFPQRRRFGNSFVAPVGKWTWWGTLSQVVLSATVALSLLSMSM